MVERIDAKALAAKLTLARRTLTVPEAAQQFLVWLREHDYTCQLSNEQIASAYQQFGLTCGAPLPGEAFVRDALRRLPGVTKKMIVIPLPGGKRKRPTIWVISKKDPLQSDQPFSEAA
jgi:hypothetical protein